MGKLHEGKVWELSIYLDKKYLHNPPLSYGVRECCLVDEVCQLSEGLVQKPQMFDRAVTGRVFFGGTGEGVNESIVVL
jgi:hypothetical protein